MLHIAYALNANQLEGLRASVSSVLTSAAHPEELTVHVLVQEATAAKCKEAFGIAEGCKGIVMQSGMLIRIHVLDKNVAQASVPNMTSKRTSQGLDATENYFRFYMHTVLEPTVVIYLDADTIVQADLAPLRNGLLESKKTIGFVRHDGYFMTLLLKKDKNCLIQAGVNYTQVVGLPYYNAGVFAVDLQRWERLGYTDRVERLVAAHNSCHGRLWDGGSQPPLMLAFFMHQQGEADDFRVFDEEWNFAKLGSEEGYSPPMLKTKSVLHWSGIRKPWKKDGLYKELWTPHREKFDVLLSHSSEAGD